MLLLVSLLLLLVSLLLLVLSLLVSLLSIFMLLEALLGRENSVAEADMAADGEAGEWCDIDSKASDVHARNRPVNKSNNNSELDDSKRGGATAEHSQRGQSVILDYYNPPTRHSDTGHSSKSFYPFITSSPPSCSLTSISGCCR